MSFGGGIGVGIGIGCASLLIALVLYFALLSLSGTFSLLIFVFPLVVGGVLMFWKKTRGMGTGVLIISAAAWITVIGPCLGLFSGG